MIWLLTTLAALGAAFYIAAPFYRESALRAPAGAPLRQRQRELETQREGLLRDLKELEFDRRMGKVDAEQYASARARATQEAARVLRQLEALSATASLGTRRPRPPQSRAQPSPGRLELELELELEVAIARARRRLRQQANWACPCGRVMRGGDVFCASCGQPRPAQAAPAQAALSQAAPAQARPAQAAPETTEISTVPAASV